MKRLLTILFLFSFYFSFGQSVVPRSNSTITVQDSRWSAFYNAVIPNYPDTTIANLHIGIDSSGAIIHTYTPDAIWFRASNPKEWQLINGSTTIANGLISIGGITVVDSTLTLIAPIVWRINGVTYTVGTNTSFVIPFADSLMYRNDLIYGDTSGTIKKIQGTEDSTIAVTPTLPNDAVSITVVYVYGRYINANPNIVGKTPNWNQVMNVGDTTYTPATIINNNGFGVMQINGNANNNTALYLKNTNNGINAGASMDAFNDLGHIGQVIMTSSGSQYGSDKMLIRSSGTGGVSITADSGRLSFGNGILGSRFTTTEFGAFETDGQLRLEKIKNNTPLDSTKVLFLSGDTVKIGTVHSGGGGGGSGTVTSISQGYGIINTPNPITTTGNVQIDSATIYGVVRSLISDSLNTIRTDSSKIYIDNLGDGDTLAKVAGTDTIQIKSLKNGYGILSTTTDTTITKYVDTSKIATQYDVGLKLNITDTTNKWVSNIYRKIGVDSIFFQIGATQYAILDSAGGGSTIKQTYTSGASVTANNTTTWLIINPASIQSALTITLAATPTDGQKIEISFGGTITSGNGVVTALTLSANSGQTLIQSSTPSFMQAGDVISYRYNSTNTSWYRIN